MKIAVLSDIHENLHNLLHALSICRDKNAEKVLCLGDLINPGIAKELAECELPTFSIWGNNDGDKVLITRIALAANSGLEVGDKTYATIQIDSRNIFMTHYPDLVKPAALSGLFDVVFYGHDHVKSQAQIDDCLIVNPGELSALQTGIASFCIYDTDSNQIESIIIEDAISTRTPIVEQHFLEKRIPNN